MKHEEEKSEEYNFHDFKKMLLGMFVVLVISTFFLAIASSYWILSNTRMIEDLSKEQTEIKQLLEKIENNTSPKQGKVITIFKHTNLSLTLNFWTNAFNVSSYRKVYIYYRWLGGNPKTGWNAYFHIADDIWSETQTFYLSNDSQSGVLELEVKGPLLYIGLGLYSASPSDPQWLIVSLYLYCVC
jgi:cell division protein FtsL